MANKNSCVSNVEHHEATWLKRIQVIIVMMLVVTPNPTNAKAPSPTVNPSPTVPELSSLPILVALGLISLITVSLRKRSKQYSK